MTGKVHYATSRDKLKVDYILGYSEAVKDRASGHLKKEDLKLEKIYSTSSGTIKDQTNPRAPESLTLVAFLDKSSLRMLYTGFDES